MKTVRNRWITGLLMMGCMVAWLACSDDTNVKTDTGGTTPDQAVADTGGTIDTGGTTDTGGTNPEASTAKANVSGNATRQLATCPPPAATGTLCLSLRTACATASTEVAKATVANAAMPTPGVKVPFTIPGAPNGSLFLWAILDADGSGCTALTTGDLYLSANCVSVTVTGGANVTGVKVDFDLKK